MWLVPGSQEAWAQSSALLKKILHGILVPSPIFKNLKRTFFICIETMVCDTKIGLCNKNRGNLFCVSGSVFVLTSKICTSGIL